MRNAILLTLAALAACDPETASLADAASDPAALPAPLAYGIPAPPLWRIDPTEDRKGWMLADVVKTGDGGVPPSLRGLRGNVLTQQQIKATVGSPLWDDFSQRPPALSREDFRRGARECLWEISGWGGWRLLARRLNDGHLAASIPSLGHYGSQESQTFWYASMRAKEAAYGIGAEEASCERELLHRALAVARGNWWEAVSRMDVGLPTPPSRKGNPAHTSGAILEYILSESGEWHRQRMPQPDEVAVERLERWLVVR